MIVTGPPPPRCQLGRGELAQHGGMQALDSHAVNRIAIIGCGGSGKSHLARALGVARAIPVIHLDTLYYDHQWNPLATDRFAELQHQLAAQPQWVIEGNYASTLAIRLAAADTVVFLDLPAWVCLWGILQRRLEHGRGQHHTIGVYDRITWSFIRYVLSYRRSMRPRVQRLLAEHARHADLVVLRSRRAVRRYLGAVRAAHPARLPASLDLI